MNIHLQKSIKRYREKNCSFKGALKEKRLTIIIIQVFILQKAREFLFYIGQRIALYVEYTSGMIVIAVLSLRRQVRHSVRILRGKRSGHIVKKRTFSLLKSL